MSILIYSYYQIFLRPYTSRTCKPCQSFALVDCMYISP
uniref:Uncharacterized protein n=1 Tax=Anopheles funestus TaxID=62324 RepID=A0A182S3Z1_ANOFN